MTNRLPTVVVILTDVAAALVIFLTTALSGESEADNMQTDKTEPKHTNHLIDENSPYLLSHAHNPVDWYPWGDEALQKAKDQNKPIFLSIGYAACHWCHVMERESFESEEIAAVLNENFVSIKVDREQRPDLDQIYMTFTTALTGTGGWPMSVFLTPDLKPFFAGTYFPPEDRFGRPGFMKLITEIARAWKEEQDKVVTSSDSILSQVSSHLSLEVGQTLLNAGMLEQGAAALMQGFDHTHGGFGASPKFPHATELSYFLRYYRRSGDLTYLQAVEKALKAMAYGGIYDQLGGGFARYSVDERWLVPHFEKMLYDNGLLAQLYAEAYQVTGDKLYLQTLRGTLDFILREMTDSTGGFYSALDADSEGEEGKFYVWSKEEIEDILGEDAELFCRYYNVTDQGNFEGRNILNLTAESERIEKESDRDDFDSHMAALRHKLFEVRSKRERPLTDDKILTSWNGLALKALCMGFQITGEERYLDAAVKNAAFVRKELFKNDRLTHAYRGGKHSDGQFLEDYGYYLSGLIELYQTDHSADNGRWLEFAVSLAENAIDLFMDDKGTLWLRPDGRDDLIMRPKDEHDGATPSPGSSLLRSLLKLDRMTDNKRFSGAAEKGLRALSGLIERAPSAMASGLIALDYYLSDKMEIVIVGRSEERDRMLSELNKRYMPDKIVAVSDTGDEDWPLFEGRSADNGELQAYVCRNSVCRLPVSTVEEFKEQLDAVM
jgi:uncharacterized protein YyaL (SSP411 family)